MGPINLYEINPSDLLKDFQYKELENDELALNIAAAYTSLACGGSFEMAMARHLGEIDKRTSRNIGNGRLGEVWYLLAAVTRHLFGKLHDAQGIELRLEAFKQTGYAQIYANEAAVLLGRKGGLKKVAKGFSKRTPAQRKAAGKKGAKTRWDKVKKESERE